MSRTAAAALALAAITASVAARGADGGAIGGPAVLVADSGASLRVAHPSVGLHRLDLAGRLQRLVASDVRVAAVSRTGAVVTAPPLGAADAQLNLTNGGRETTLPNSSGGRCAAFSSDGSLVAYVAGETKLTSTPAVSYFRITGTLWLVDVNRPHDATAVASGVFATSECPLWSPLGHSLAFLVQNAGMWRLEIWNDGHARPVAADASVVPSAHDRSFAWSPTGGGRLSYLQGDDVHLSATAIRRGVLARVHGQGRFNRGLAYSPNGRYLAASVGIWTALLRNDGKLVRFVRGHELGWSGNRAVLTIADDRHFIPSLFRFPIAGGRATALARHFKQPLVSDPRGGWFAYATTKTVFLRRSDGSLLRTVTLPFVVDVEAAVAADGRIATPVGSY